MRDLALHRCTLFGSVAKIIRAHCHCAGAGGLHALPDGGNVHTGVTQSVVVVVVVVQQIIDFFLRSCKLSSLNSLKGPISNML